jgi:hypothetical protein
MRKIPRRFHFDRRIKQILEALKGGNPDDLFCTKKAAEFFGISVEWFEIARCSGFGPKFQKQGPKLVMYTRQALIDFCDERLRFLRGSRPLSVDYRSDAS